MHLIWTDFISTAHEYSLIDCQESQHKQITQSLLCFSIFRPSIHPDAVGLGKVEMQAGSVSAEVHSTIHTLGPAWRPLHWEAQHTSRMTSHALHLWSPSLPWTRECEEDSVETFARLTLKAVWHLPSFLGLSYGVLYSLFLGSPPKRLHVGVWTKRQQEPAQVNSPIREWPWGDLNVHVGYFPVGTSDTMGSR